MRFLITFISLTLIIFTAASQIVFSSGKPGLPQPDNIRGLHMTAGAASGRGKWARDVRNNFLEIVKKTEINGIVIDVKEVCGPVYNEAILKNFLAELHRNNVWVIARIVVLKDASQINEHPDWYLKRKAPIPVGHSCFNLQAPIGGEVFWQDKTGGYWLDPASFEVKDYILNFSKKMIDLGFDEIQFDYLRFPSDGDIENAIYPSYNKKIFKHEAIKSFSGFLSKNLKTYKPNIILSIDFFGYAALRADAGVGQLLEDVGDNFDYISFMLYPSHYYNGFYAPIDKKRNLPLINFNREGARKNPDVIVSRSLLFAEDFLSRIHPRVKIRPWLEDFFHESDKIAGRPFGVQKIKLQIQAAREAGASGWMLWNAGNVYVNVK